jgi:hypothetical protein
MKGSLAWTRLDTVRRCAPRSGYLDGPGMWFSPGEQVHAVLEAIAPPCETPLEAIPTGWGRGVSGGAGGCGGGRGGGDG